MKKIVYFDDFMGKVSCMFKVDIMKYVEGYV